MHDLLIIRHGESEWNLEGRWQGWLDAPLTDLGVQQAHERAAALARAGFEPVVVHCSDLGRALHTAEIIAGVLGSEARPHAGLRERSAGEWEGHTTDEIDQRWPGMRQTWQRGELSAPPGGEEEDAVLARLDGAIADVLSGPAPALVVTHGGVLRMIATRAGVDVRALIPNLSGYWFAADRGVLCRPEPVEPLTSPTHLPVAE